MNRSRSSNVIDVKICRRVNCDSEIKVRQKISSSVKVKGGRKTRWNIEKLKIEKVMEDFQNKIADHLAKAYNNKDVESEWNNIK